MDNADEDQDMARLRAWLPEQSPRTWHQVALSWNWDNGTDLLDWILDQPDCDRGTALAIYMMGEPDYYTDEFGSIDEARAVDHFGVKDAEFLSRICRRWDQGAFPEYRYHPTARGLGGNPWQEVPPGMIRARAPWPVPASMAAAPLRGEAVDFSQFSEGMPNAWFGPVAEDRSLLQWLKDLNRRTDV